MGDGPPDDNEAPQGGVFGKLPDSRPGTRSPQRDAGTKGKPSQQRTPKVAAPERDPQPATAPRAQEPRPRQPEAQGEQGGGLDDLAWAGVAALAEAATLGVRLANRALGALRGGEEDAEEDQ